MTGQTDRELIGERLESARGRIAQIPGEAAVPEPFREYFSKTAAFLLMVGKTADNQALYRDILPGAYGTSYANPAYASRVLGKEYGPLLAAVYAELRGIIPAVFEDDAQGTAVLLELFLELYFEFEREEPPAPGVVRNIFGMYIRDYAADFVRERLEAQLVPDHSFVGELIRTADFSSTDYLYRYGEYISGDVIRTAEFINKLPEESIRKMADTFTEGFRLGFVRGGKSYAGKKTVQVVYELGFERMIRAAMDNFARMGLQPTFVRSPVRLISRSANRKAGYTGAVPNWQFDYDHREDLALVMDGEYVSMRKRIQREVFESLREEAAAHAGPAVLETFGEMPFVPLAKEEAIRMDAGEREHLLGLKNALLLITRRYIPEETRSFTIIDFPVPAVGADFEDIFRDTVEVNTLDQERFREIQQTLIDALDQGVAVHVTGRNGNETDLTIALHGLTDPATQTNFENCLADVNIPVGEVFTSPRLAGTNGLLHVKKVFLNGYEYRDLRIEVKEGMTGAYSCGNYGDPAKGRRYIEENILFHHPSLTMGEFAVGTNTAAYVMGRRYGIEDRLPILIAEKTGPHFAFGDTCYSMDEDRKVYNPDGREIVAKDNEHTVIRKTDPSGAYYGCHTDVTIPYSELGGITVMRADGSGIPLVADGRFVLPGTEELNVPLDAFLRGISTEDIVQ